MKKILDIVKRFFAKNTAWKLLSLVIAIGLWISVMTALNPTETKTFTVPITLANEEALMNRGYAVLNKQELLETKVDVQVTGTRGAIDELSRKTTSNMLVANVDLQEIEIDSSMALPQNISISIVPKISNVQLYSYEISSFNPTFINVSVDSVAEKTLAIKTNLMGSLPEGYVAQEPVYNVSEILVRGSAKRLEQLSDIIATINIDGAEESVSTDVVPVAIDKNGQEMTDFVLTPAVIQAKVGINKIKTIKINQPAVKGELHDDLILQGIEWSPKEIQVVGTPDEIEKIKDITLPEIDMSKLLGSDIYTYELSRYISENDNLHLKSGTSKNIIVKVNILGKDGKNLTIPASNVDIVGANPNYTSRIPDKIIVTVFGSKEDLAKVNNDTSQLKPTLDVSNLSVGGHQVPLKLELPDGVETRTDLSVYVIISEKTDLVMETTTVVTTEAKEHNSEATTENPEQLDEEMTENVAEVNKIAE